jgi:hypothetical protein
LIFDYNIIRELLYYYFKPFRVIINGNIVSSTVLHELDSIVNLIFFQADFDINLWIYSAIILNFSLKVVDWVLLSFVVIDEIG